MKKLTGFKSKKWFGEKNLGLTALSLLTQAIKKVLNPGKLFRDGEQGVFYDPSDITTLFQDSAGTTPVTASGQPVGLMLDKSRGLERGPELFATPVLGAWTSNGGGSYSLVGDGSYQILAAPQNATTGRAYEYTFTVSALSGVLRIVAGSAFFNATVAGTYKGVLIATDSSQIGFVRSSGSVSATVSAITIKELPGNHATQATAASRPIYRRGDHRGVVNLLTWSEAFDNAAWTKGTDSTITPNTTLAPDGTVTADTYQNTGNNREISQIYLTPTPEGNTFTASISIKPGTLSTFGYKIRRGDASDAVVVNNISITAGTPEANGFYRHKLTHTFSSSTTGDNVVVLIGANFGEAGTMMLHGAQLNLGSTATPYQRNDSHLGGVATGAESDLRWLEFDGVDDWMSTGNIDFTSTDKMSVFAGVRKLSDAATGSLFELSADSTSTAGTFGVFAPISAGASYQYRSGGSIPGILANTGVGEFPAPHSAVLSGASSISADSVSQRVNGMAKGSSSADQGTGNYGNHPLYIGRRGGTSLPFNGWLYGLIIRGALTSDANIITTEKYLSAKTAVTLP